MTNTVNSLYIHIPFCNFICDYCDFTKLQYFHNFASNYIAQLKKEIESFNINNKLKTIFIGGGTPTSLEDDLFEDILSFASNFLADNGEFSIECNPESLSLSKIKILKKYHVNRISIGVESTNDEILKSINRHHTFNDVINVMNLLKENGIFNINIDLILGLPNVTISLLKKDIENVIKLEPTHISCYGLTVHEHTVFFNKNIREPLDDELRKMYDIINKKLNENGFIHYEISNWCKQGFECKHNLTYWKDEQYYGAGLGASGYINNIRYTRSKNLNRYLSNFTDNESSEIISKDDDLTYYIMLNLRTKYGIDLDEFKEKFGFDLYTKSADYIGTSIKQNLLELRENVLIATFDGMMILDQIILNLIP